jgi:hypothetical protein
MNRGIQLIFNPLATPLTIIAITRKPAISVPRRLVLLALCLAMTSSLPSFQAVVVAQGPMDDAFPITTASNNQTTPAVAYNANIDEFLVAWVDGRNPVNGTDIYGRRLAGDGEPLGGELAIAEAPAAQLEPALTPRSGFPDYLVVWGDLRNFDGTDLDIYGQQVGAGGALPGGNIPISTLPGRQRTPAAAHCPPIDSYLIIWDEDEDASLPWWFYTFGQQVSSDGLPIGETITATADYPRPGFQQIQSDLVYNPQRNEYLAVYRDAREYWQGSGFNDDIYGQRLSCAGEPLLEDDLPITTQYSQSPAGNKQNAPAVAYDSQRDQYLVVWQDERNDPDASTWNDHLDVYGQMLAGDGGPVCTDVATNTTVTKARGNQKQADVAYSPQSDAYLVVWEDHRGTDADIYARLVSGTCTPLCTEVVISGVTGDQVAPTVAYNQATGQFLIVWEDHRNQASSGADIYGRLYLPPETCPLYLPLVSRGR